MYNKTKIITFAHCKGGVGKSTLCCHVISILKLLKPNLRIGLLDLDYVQNTSYNFFINKKQPLNFLSKCTELNEIKNIIYEEDLDILVIDTAGGSNIITETAIQLTNILITPIQHSLVDIKSLVDMSNGKIIDGPFTKIINKNSNKSFKWFIVGNKLPLVNSDTQYSDLLEQIAFRLGARLLTVYDRPEYKMSFEDGQITPSEFINTRYDFTRGQKAAASEIEAIYKLIINYLNI